MSKAAASVEKYWAGQVDLMRSLPGAVRRREPDSIHDLRAAGRRLRATIRIYRPLLPQKQAARLLDGLRWYNGVLGEARDAEVAAQHVGKLLEVVSGGSSLPGSDELIARLAEHQERTAAAADEMLSSGRSEALVEELSRFVAAPWRAPMARGGRGPRRSQIVKRVAWAERRASTVWEQFDGASLASEALAPTRHRLRRRIKAARYGYESLGGTVKDASERAERHALAADVLGEMQDAVVLEEVLSGDSSPAAQAVLSEQRNRSLDAAERATGIVRDALA